MKTILTILTTLVAFFIPVMGMVYSIGAFVSFDTIFAMYVAKKQKEPLTSDSFFNIAPKLFFYIGTILLGYMVDCFIMTTNIFDIQYLGAKVITLMFICNETKSIDETFYKYKKIHILDIVRKYVKVLKSLKKDLNELLNND